MQLNVEESVCKPLKSVRHLAPRRFSTPALAVVVATLLAVASPGRVSAERVSATRVIFSSAHFASRAPAATAPTAQGMVSWDISSADVFMQAIIAQNGQLAWQQLCPVLQAKVPVSTLANLMNSDNSTNQGVQLQLDAVGSHVWSDGGAIHVYVVTAHRSPGADARMLFVLRTQASGCIDGILNA